MKVKEFKSQQLLKLHLLRSKVYQHPIKKTNFNALINTNLDQILIDIKRALQLIFQYHQTEKRILFIGFPSRLESKINILTQHVAVPASFNVQGLLSNNNSRFLQTAKGLAESWLRKHSKFLLPKLAKTPDLVIVLDHEKRETIFSEALAVKVPVITFSSDVGNNSLINNFYNVKGNFKNISLNSEKNIFFIGLNFLFKNFKKKRKKATPMPRKRKF